MIVPARGKILATKISREKVLDSGIVIPDRLKSEKIDNCARVLGVGSPTPKTCYLCHDKPRCKLLRKGRHCKEHGKIMPITARRGDIIHYKEVFAQKLRYEGQDYVFMTAESVIAIEGELNNGKATWIQAVGSMVIIKLIRENNVGSIVLSDGAKVLEGDYFGETISIGPDFHDKSLKAGDKLFYNRDEGYRFIGFNDRQDYLAIKERWACAKEK
jgi:co-chaperonin GroES (HSP10)